MGLVSEVVDHVGGADTHPVDGEGLRSHYLHEALAQVSDQPVGSHGNHGTVLPGQPHVWIAAVRGRGFDQLLHGLSHCPAHPFRVEVLEQTLELRVSTYIFGDMLGIKDELFQ